ncbi:MAG: hypothetical protein QOD73_167 [Solirubrobacteraceae bacterium]|nr:hypothetical protein [Solirubrobacteraceae bacterium]
METETALSRREAALRSAATTCLGGIALVQAIELPSLFVQGRQLAALSVGAMAMCVALVWALATVPAAAARQLWRVVAAGALLVLTAWLAPHVVSVPEAAHHVGHWTVTPGAVSAALAAVCLVVAVAAAPPGRVAPRTLVTAVAVVVGLAPGVSALAVAAGPGVPGGEQVLAAGGHIHSHGSPESAIVYQQLPGGHGGHYVYQAVAVPHPTVLGLSLLFAAAFMFIYGAVGCLRRRVPPAEPVAPAEPVSLAGLERGLA